MTRESTLYNPPAVKMSITKQSDKDFVQISFVDSDLNASGPIAHPTLTATSLETSMVKIREVLSNWSKKYDELLEGGSDKLTCKTESVEQMWNDLASYGRDVYNDLFTIQNPRETRVDELTNASEEIKKLPLGARVRIDNTAGEIPWALLYDNPVPPIDECHSIEEVKSHFWGLKYQLELIPFFPRRLSFEKDKYYLRNKEITRLTVTINEQMDNDYNTGQKDFFEHLTTAFKLLAASSTTPPLLLNFSKARVIDSLRKREEPQHLYYFFCHHCKGDGIYDAGGWRRFENSNMIVQGQQALKDSAITPGELKRDETIKFFECPPVVFMNACESSQTEQCSPSGFMAYFTGRLAAHPFIGTEALIPATFASAYGRRFIQGFLRGRSIGKILLDANQFFATNHHNPFGLYYTLYGDGNTRLFQALEETVL